MNKLDFSEWAVYYLTAELPLRAGQVSYWHRDISVGESFLLRGIEVTASTLRDCTVSLRRSVRTVFESPMHVLTVQDHALEARVRNIESLIDGILSTDMDADSSDPAERRLAERKKVLERLGYQPSRVLDARVIDPPILFSATERLEIRVEVGFSGPPRETPCQVLLHGHRKVPTA